MNVDCSGFMTSTPATVLESRNCKHCVNSLLCCCEANSIPICHDHLEKTLLFFFIIGDESVEFLEQLHTPLSRVVHHSQLLNSLSTLFVILILDPFLLWKCKKVITNLQVWQQCQFSLGCKITQASPLLQYRSITSHLPFTRLCSYSVNNIHLICYWKLVWEQCQTYSLIWKVSLVVSRAFLAATLISGSTDSYFPRLIQSDRSCPGASAASEAFVHAFV